MPYKADQAVQVALKHMREPMPSVRAINSTVPQSLENIITRCTAKDPSLRYPNAEEMLVDVSTCLRPERLNERRLLVKETTVKKTGNEQPKAVPVRNEKKKETASSSAKARAEMEKESRKRKTLMILIGVVCSLVIVGGLSALAFTGVISFGKQYYVPQIVGLPMSDALEVLQKETLQVDEEKIRYELTVDMAAGMIIDVTPKEGEKVDKDSTVEIVVSSGIGVKAKDYTGRDVNEVIAEISKDYPNMKVQLQPQSSPITSGTILDQQTLQAGDLFDPNKVNTISFTYSAYPTVIIPDDIIGKSINDAVKELEEMGLKVYTSNRSLPKDIDEMTPEEQASISFGTVIDCSPASGTSYTQSTDNYVTLYYY